MNWAFVSYLALFCIMWSEKWTLAFDVCSDPVCFPLSLLWWLLQLDGLFTRLHNELLIIPGPHQMCLGSTAKLPPHIGWHGDRRGRGLHEGGRQKDCRSFTLALCFRGTHPYSKERLKCMVAIKHVWFEMLLYVYICEFCLCVPVPECMNC